MPPALTREEVAYLRTELLPRFGLTSRLSEGILLRSWKSGPLSGTPRLPPAVKSLIDKQCVQVRQPSPGQPFRAFWTSTGLTALANAARNHKAFPSDRYAHVLAELADEIVTLHC